VHLAWIFAFAVDSSVQIDKHSTYTAGFSKYVKRGKHRVFSRFPRCGTFRAAIRPRYSCSDGRSHSSVRIGPPLRAEWAIVDG